MAQGARSLNGQRAGEKGEIPRGRGRRETETRLLKPLPPRRQSPLPCSGAHALPQQDLGLRRPRPGPHCGAAAAPRGQPGAHPAGAVSTGPPPRAHSQALWAGADDTRGPFWLSIGGTASSFGKIAANYLLKTRCTTSLILPCGPTGTLARLSSLSAHT